MKKKTMKKKTMTEEETTLTNYTETYQAKLLKLWEMVMEIRTVEYWS
jgi:hypothetical protein